MTAAAEITPMATSTCNRSRGECGRKDHRYHPCRVPHPCIIQSGTILLNEGGQAGVHQLHTYTALLFHACVSAQQSMIKPLGHTHDERRGPQGNGSLFCSLALRLPWTLPHLRMRCTCPCQRSTS